MRRPKLLIVVLFQNLCEEEPYYAPTPAPPLPGALLAGMTPPIVDIELLHEMVRPIDYETDAEFVALSFMDYLAPHAYEVARRFRQHGKVVVGGGKFISTFPDQAQPFFDSVLVGEAQGVWPRMVEDMVAGRLQPRYVAAEGAPLAGIPAPRYDLVERAFSVPIVTETSRGCPFACTYCQLNIRRQPYRTRPVADVMRDLTSTAGLPFHRRKLAMILDNNLGGDLDHAKALLREIAKLDFWGIGVQLSIDCLEDEELVDLLAKARCCMAFVGLESLSEASLRGVGKRHNRVEEYERLFGRLHRRGIVTFVGLMFALDEDTAEDYRVLAEKLERTGVCVVLSSIAVPIYGTPLHRKMAAEGRILDEDLSHYEGDHLVFRHPHLSADQIHEAYASFNRTFYAWPAVARRLLHFLAAQSRQENLVPFLRRLAVASFAMLRLSVFERRHAQHRVRGWAADSVRDPLSAARAVPPPGSTSLAAR
jgi:radical SAM superfamily enzyme YgiQ (UPF0313 family)